jgi:NAD kinase
MLLNRGLSVTSFPNLHLKGVDHIPTMKDVGTKVDLMVTVSGDGTILRVLRILDNTVPCLCVNVGGRGILAEIKPDQARIAFDRILKGDLVLERRARISSRLKEKTLPPALNEVHLVRQTHAHTPSFTIDFDSGAVFTQRMEVFMITPEGSISRFPTVVKSLELPVRVLGSFALDLVIDGQEVFNVEPDTFATFKRHERDAVFVRFDTAGSFRQIKNLGFK